MATTCGVVPLRVACFATPASSASKAGGTNDRGPHPACFPALSYDATLAEQAAALALPSESAQKGSTATEITPRSPRLGPPTEPRHRGNSLPQRQHLLLVSGVAMCVKRTRSDRQPLSLTSSHVSHLNGDDFRHISNPTFFYIQRQNSKRPIVLPP
jgi:hypothetical protein